jgi:hypothetical protein
MAKDISGYSVFSGGHLGAAHVMAHRMCDERRFQDGYERLGAWLRPRRGSGSDWVHLQWHMMVFELAVDRWDEAVARFEEHILPVARDSRDALTDAPAALWRLAIDRDCDAELPWEIVAATAADSLGSDDPYVELHHLLALCGAGDVDAIDRWLARYAPSNERESTLLRVARGLRDFAAANYLRAAAWLSTTIDQVPTLGGSHAQNQLLLHIQTLAWRRARG